MSAKSRKEVLEQARQRYGKRGREGRSRLLDEVCELCGYERKYAIKVLRGKRAIMGSKGRKRGGSQAIYGGGTRSDQGDLAGGRTTLRQALKGGAGRLAEALRQKVLAISSSSIDRLLAPCRTSPGSASSLRDAPRVKSR